MTAATRQSGLSELEQAIAEVATLETIAEEISVRGWRAWDEGMKPGASYDLDDAAAEECAIALDEARERLAALRGGAR